MTAWKSAGPATLSDAMGKASSNKKVARAAGTGGGRTHRRQTPWTYFGVIALIVILGVAATISSRDRRLSQINTAGGDPAHGRDGLEQGLRRLRVRQVRRPIIQHEQPRGHPHRRPR